MAFEPVKRVFERVETHSYELPMTLEGTLTKLAVLLLTALSAGCIGWMSVSAEGHLLRPFLLAAPIGGIVLGMISVFWPRVTMYTALPYALCQGITLGLVSAFAELRFPGIAAIAIALTLATAIGMLLLYRLEIIRVNDKFKALLLSATAGIALTYGFVLLLGLFGVKTAGFFESSSIQSIVFSLFVVGIAALNLLLDFALIEESVEVGLPKYMEWYAGFTVLVTLIWLYVEILRLLQKFARRKD